MKFRLRISIRCFEIIHLLQARPLSDQELSAGDSECIEVLAERNQIKSENKIFTYDAVYDSAVPQKSIYSECVEKLVSSCFRGYNATG